MSTIRETLKKIPRVNLFLPLVIPSFILLLGSCSASRMTFTPDIVREFRLQNDDLMGLLFYTNSTIKIRKEVDGHFRQLISTSKLVKRGGKTYEVITISKGTPGILSIRQGDSLLISFADNKKMLFIPDRKEKTYTSNRGTTQGQVQIGDQWYTSPREPQLSIGHKTYEKFSLPRYTNPQYPRPQ